MLLGLFAYGGLLSYAQSPIIPWLGVGGLVAGLLFPTADSTHSVNWGAALLVALTFPMAAIF